MSDLSRLLEDVYNGETSSPEPPEWSSDEALEDVFASWSPGEQPTAPVDAFELPSLDEQPLATVVPIRGRWTPSDDDILPGRAGKKKRGGFRLR